jgi:Protein of unknown function (DUF3575)
MAKYLKIQLVAALSFFGGYGQAQNTNLPTSDSHIRLNVLQLPLGLLNMGYEKHLTEHSSYKLDVVLSPWKSYLGHPAFFSILFVEWRYYFGRNFTGYYLGANMGGGIFRMQKWNYWTENKFYQVGWNSMFGLSMGYQQQLNPKYSLDYFVNVGNSQGHYWGYRTNNGSRYIDYNHSGEWIPLNAGIQLVYKL